MYSNIKIFFKKAIISPEHLALNFELSIKKGYLQIVTDYLIFNLLFKRNLQIAINR